MTPREYWEKATDLLNTIQDYDGSDIALYNVYDKAKDEFLHLVFFFNPEIPMYKEMTSKDPEISGLTKYDRNPRKYIERFIYYLEEYFDVF